MIKEVLTLAFISQRTFSTTMKSPVLTLKFATRQVNLISQWLTLKLNKTSSLVELDGISFLLTILSMYFKIKIEKESRQELRELLQKTCHLTSIISIMSSITTRTVEDKIPSGQVEEDLVLDLRKKFSSLNI